jgi:hypothetical protein
MNINGLGVNLHVFLTSGIDLHLRH